MRVYRPAVMEDLPRLQELVRRSRMKMNGVPSITFVAEEDGVIQAAMGLDFEKDQIRAGPFVIATEAKKKYFLLLRLIESMETWLIKGAGPKVDYILAIPRSNKRWNHIVSQFARRYAVKDGRNWYTRRAGSGRT